MIHTIFKTKQLNPMHSITELYYLQGNRSIFENIDFNTDYRFKEVKGLRAKAEIIGEIDLEPIFKK